jgi:hypothetical protein
MSAAEAKQQLLAGVAIENCRIESLDLGDDGKTMEYARPVVLRRCLIGSVTLAGAKFASEFHLEGSVVDGHLWAGALRENPNSPASPEKRPAAIFESHCILLGSGIQGDFDLVRVSGKSFSLTRVTVEGQLRAMGMGLSGRFDVEQFVWRKGLDARGARFGGGIILEKGKSEGALLFGKVRCGGVRLKNVQVSGQADFGEIACSEGSLALIGFDVEGDLRLDFSVWQEAQWDKVKVSGVVRGQQLRLAGKWQLRECTAKAMEIRQAQLRDIKFDNCRSERLALTQTHVNDDLHLVNTVCGQADWGSLKVDREINCHKCKFEQGIQGKWLTVGLFLLRNCNVAGPLNLEESLLAKFSLRATTCHQNVVLSLSKISGKLDLGAATILGDLQMCGIQVEGLGIFFNGRFHTIDATDAQFRSAVYFLRPEVWQHFADIPENLRKPAEVAGNFLFAHAQFKELLLAEQVRFGGKVQGQEAVFHGDVSFHGAQFASDLDLHRCRVMSSLNLSDSKIEGNLMLDECDIHRRLDLVGCVFQTISFAYALIDHFAVAYEQLMAHAAVGRRLVHAQNPPDFVKARSEFLLLRDAFAQMGHHDAQDWAHWQLKRIERKMVSRRAWQTLCHGPSFLARLRALSILASNSLERWFIDAGSGYGTQPARVGLLAFIIMLVFSIFYFLHFDQVVFSDLSKQGGNTFLLSLYFSVTNFTTMGLGNVYPTSDGWLKYLVASEALFGILLMTLFVGTWTRKIVR